MYQVATAPVLTNEILNQDTKISISTSHTIELVNVSDILYLEGKENYCRIYLRNELSFLANQSLGKMYEALRPYNFFQCHKSYAINMEQVIRYWRIGKAELKCGAKVPVARRRRDGFIENFK